MLRLREGFLGKRCLRKLLVYLRPWGLELVAGRVDLLFLSLLQEGVLDFLDFFIEEFEQ
jgi:hypothetical protein